MLASIASVIMGAMIWVSGTAPLEMLWFMAAGVALIAGSGSTFGLDYYVLPFLKKTLDEAKTCPQVVLIFLETYIRQVTSLPV